MADINLSIGAVVEERSYKQAMSKIKELGLQGAREGHERYLQKQIKTLQTRKPTADTARIIKNLQKQLNDVDAIYKWINKNSPKTISMGASYNNNLPALPLKTSVLNNKITGLNVKKHPNTLKLHFRTACHHLRYKTKKKKKKQGRGWVVNENR